MAGDSLEKNFTKSKDELAGMKFDKNGACILSEKQQNELRAALEKIGR